MRTPIFTAFAALAVFVSPVLSYAAAQLAAGATTSARPTSTNPAIRQMQLTFDPDVDPALTTGGTFNVTDFQLSIQFDPTKVQILSQSDIQLVGPYTEPVVSITTETPSLAGPASSPSNLSEIDNLNGFVHFIAGTAPVANTQPGDVDIFSIFFTLNAGVSFNDPLFFKIFADPDFGDFIQGTDPNTLQTAFSPAANVTPTILQGSFNQFSAQIAAAGGGVPLPPALWSALATLLAAGLVSRRWRGGRALSIGC